jgi:DNA adenine methylase
MSKLARSKYLKRLSETNPKLCNNIEICIRYHNNVLLRRKDNVIMKFGNKEFTSAFLKWAGGKSKLTEQIQNLFPFDIKGSYVEPFAGSGVVALNTKANHHWINDINDDLVLLWKTVQSSPDDLIKECLPLFSKEYNTQEKYYELRDEFNNGAKGIRRAALFIYLNRHCFNGLCRYNSKGKFNVPCGKYSTIGFPEDEIRIASDKIKNWKITSLDFRKVMGELKKGDTCYVDPPYVSLTETANFSDYAKEGFNQKDQIDLADCAKDAAKRGALVIISNHNTDFSRGIYEERGATIYTLNVKRSIASKTKNRKEVPELLAVFGNKT